MDLTTTIGKVNYFNTNYNKKETFRRNHPRRRKDANEGLSTSLEEFQTSQVTSCVTPFDAIIAPKNCLLLTIKSINQVGNCFR